MIPDFVAKLGAACSAPLDFAATGCVLSVTLTPETIHDAVAVMDKEGYLLEDVMASDLQEGFEVLYHLSLLDGANRVVLRLTVPHDAPKVPTISDIYPGADWHERECFDFYGIDFVGHPNLHYLLLPEDFDGHPLVKAPKARKSLADLVPLSYLVDCGLAEPEPEPKAKPKPVAKAASPASNDA
ncbi:MAG: NADH-quinone oxidoreductase subunit C [Solidesulfovibrio sp. DCME]|uniref:NADH-quinone oxidoreductase subunit C n=1 Tax=Solidesulfovibrio sp. DCME TaxID=3447380 RepID=UPI003D0ED7E6